MSPGGIGIGPGAHRVLVVGDVMVDVLVEVRSPFAHASDTPSSIATAPGGAAANLASWLARAGQVVGIVAAVGDDPIGDAAIRALEAEGVDTSAIAVVARPTGTVVALVEPDGQRSMLTDRGANRALDPAVVEYGLGTLHAGEHVHVSGYVILEEATRAAGLRAIELAREAGATTSLDASSSGPLRAAGPERFLEWAAGSTYLLCNLDEGTLLTGGEDAAAAAAALVSIAAEVVVTDGARGAVVATAAGTVSVPAASTSATTDTTGAGDAFNGTYLARRLAGDDALVAGAAAAASASGVVAARGARAWARGALG